MRMPIAVTTALDVLGLLMVSGGVGAGLRPVIGWWCIGAAGVVVLVGSGLAALRSTASPGEVEP